MRISHKYKFVFISKPRCASTTIRTILDPYTDIFSTDKAPYHHHATALELKVHFDSMGWNWKDYFVFTTVRNPWEMMVSYYAFFKPDINYLYNYEKERDGIIYQPNNPASFNDWIRNGKTRHRLVYINGERKTNIWVNGFSKLTLDNAIQDIDGTSLVDLIIPVENINNGIHDVLNRIGLKSEYNGKLINQSDHLPYRHYYDDISRKIIEKEFAFDIENGKYLF